MVEFFEQIMNQYMIEPSVTLLLIFVLYFCIVGHLMFFHIYFNYVNFDQKLQDFLYARQGARNYVFNRANRKWFTARKNRNV